MNLDEVTFLDLGRPCSNPENKVYINLEKHLTADSALQLKFEFEFIFKLFQLGD